MVTIDRQSDEPYVAEIGDTSLMSVADKEKRVPVEWVNDTGNGLTEDFMRYIRPLVSGAVLTVGDELPSWPRLKRFMVDRKLAPYQPPK